MPIASRLGSKLVPDQYCLAAIRANKRYNPESCMYILIIIIRFKSLSYVDPPDPEHYSQDDYYNYIYIYRQLLIMPLITIAIIRCFRCRGAGVVVSCGAAMAGAGARIVGAAGARELWPASSGLGITARAA